MIDRDISATNQLVSKRIRISVCKFNCRKKENISSGDSNVSTSYNLMKTIFFTFTNISRKLNFFKIFVLKII